MCRVRIVPNSSLISRVLIYQPCFSKCKHDSGSMTGIIRYKNQLLLLLMVVLLSLYYMDQIFNFTNHYHKHKITTTIHQISKYTTAKIDRDKSPITKKTNFTSKMPTSLISNILKANLNKFDFLRYEEEIKARGEESNTCVETRLIPSFTICI